MKIKLQYSANQNDQGGNWLGCNISDFCVSLNDNLKKHFSGSCKVIEDKPCILVVGVVGATKKQIAPLVDAFLKSMRKNGYKMIVAYDT